MPKYLYIIGLLCSFCIVHPAIAETDLFSERTLRIGFDVDSLPDISRTDLEVSLKFWADEISEQTNVPISVTFYHDQMKQMLKDFESGKLNFIFTAPIQFVKQFNRDLLADGFTTRQNAQHFDTLVILTRQHESTDTIQQLKNHRITLQTNNELHLLYLDLLSFQTFKQSYRNSFHLTTPEKNSQRLILQLFFKKTDAVLVSEGSFNLASELNPQLGNSLQVVARLPNVPPGTGFFHKAVAEDFREEVIGKAEKLNHYRRGQQVLEIFKATQVQRSAISDLDSIVKLYQELSTYKSQASKP